MKSSSQGLRKYFVDYKWKVSKAYRDSLGSLRPLHLHLLVILQLSDLKNVGYLATPL